MQAILTSLHVYRETNDPEGTWPPPAALINRAKAVQATLEQHMRHAGYPSPSLSLTGRYGAQGGRLFPIPVWETAARIELNRLGIADHKAVRPERRWTTSQSFAETYRLNLEPAYIRTVEA